MEKHPTTLYVWTVHADVVYPAVGTLGQYAAAFEQSHFCDFVVSPVLWIADDTGALVQRERELTTVKSAEYGRADYTITVNGESVSGWIADL